MQRRRIHVRLDEETLDRQGQHGQWRGQQPHHPAPALARADAMRGETLASAHLVQRRIVYIASP